MFNNINQERFDLFNQSGGLNGLKTNNKFNIMDWAPKNEEDEIKKEPIKKK